jgi:hypothetical protein
MGRPKASEHSLSQAHMFANAVTIVTGHKNKANMSVDRRGKFSIFGLISRCFPGLVRKVDGVAGNRSIMSEIELNKYLAKHGFIASRDRNRVKGTVDQWEKGKLRWKNRRWINPSNSEDLQHLRATLSEYKIPCIFLDSDLVISKLRKFWNEILIEDGFKPSLETVPRIRTSICNRMLLKETSLNKSSDFKYLPFGIEHLVIPFYQVCTKDFCKVHCA